MKTVSGPRRVDVVYRRIDDDFIDPEVFRAQPTLSISSAPTLAGDCLAPRRLNLRPFILQSSGLYATTGGLTRAALKAGSLVANSSQGGAAKIPGSSTWRTHVIPGSRELVLDGPLSGAG